MEKGINKLPELFFEGGFTVIEDLKTGIPVPPRTSFTFLDSLQPGESVLVTGANPYSLESALQYRQSRDGKRFSRRKAEGGYRVWRTA
jgi:hypothetical protein